MKLRYKISGGILIVLGFAVLVLGMFLGHNADCGPAPAVPPGSETMKAIVYRCYGSADVLELEDVAKPAPAEDEVLVRIRAASVNPLDWHYMRGSPYIMRLESGIGAPTHTRMGVDFAGTVESVGKAVTQFRPGDEVFGGGGGAWFGPLVRPIQAMLVSPFVSQHMSMMLAEFRKDDFVYLAELLQSGQLTSAIDRRYPLREVADAIRYSEEGRARGKIIIDIP